MADMYLRDAGGIPLGAALAELPLATPDASAWPMLATRLANRQATAPRRIWPFAAAVAASLLALALLPRGGVLAPENSTGAPVAATIPLDRLIAESARLESLISSSDVVSSSASAAVLSLELEERLQQLDARLAAAPDDAERQSLWQQRVALLRDYAGFESTRRWYAAEGRNLDVALVAAY